MHKEEIISELKKGNRDVLKRVYLDYKVEFFKFSSRYDLKKEDFEDVYQDAVIVVYENAQKGKLDDLKSTLKTYLFSVGKYMIFDKSRRNLKTCNPEDDYVFNTHDYATMNSVLEDKPLNLYQQKLIRNFKLLGEKCRQILSLFYYRGLTIDEIVDIQGYENKNVVKSQKSRCLKTLKEFIKKEND
ncbi:sigma-70 family RNA polymerase sigma factor [Gaetbulibacter sp. M240]|uniref:RNA polymerase sigma factor n=1 Tax=Gaetbulibacter sp. M240 TaxID=3126511 RepID=UPI00374F318A